MALKLKIVLFLYCCLCSSVKFINAAQCSKDWFGPRCQYKCHCKGECVDGDCQEKCENGWFGFKCQYKDLAPSIPVFQQPKDKLRHLVDNDDSTCLDLKNIYIDLGGPYDITWMRLEFHDQTHLEKLKTWFKNAYNTVIPIFSNVNFILNGRTVDVQVLVSERVRTIQFVIDENQQLCSLHISNGRNVAPKQTVNQSTTYGDLNRSQASNAIDGNTNNDFMQGSCTHTDERDPSPTWRMFLYPAYLIKSIVLYNRLDKNVVYPNRNGRKENKPSVRLKSFQLKTIDEKNQEAFTYKDENPSALQQYNVVPTTRRLTKEISITAHDTSDGLYLALCEVEVYAECPVGRWGLECDGTCEVCNGSCRLDDGACEKLCRGNPLVCSQKCEKGKYGNKCQHVCSQYCLKTEKPDHCDPVNGNCIYGCKAGYKQPLCREECNGGTYGNNCSRNCSSNCIQSCHFKTGKCHGGCTIGYQGDYCNNTCDQGKYGDKCNKSCSQNCASKIKTDYCNHIDGYCQYGCNAGYQLPLCQTTCSEGRYGVGCNKHCSENCKLSTCDAVNGNCTDGCIAGFDGTHCDKECDAGYYGENCSESCSETCLNNTCNTISGHCDACRAGYEGINCKQAITGTINPETIYIVVLIALIIVILLVILILILWRRRKNNYKNQQQNCHGLSAVSFFKTFGKTKTGDYVEDDNEIELSFAHNETFEAEDQGNESETRSTSINVKDLLSYLTRPACNKDFFIQQFKSVRDPANVTQEAALMESNKPKNRYKNICPYDHSRVLLNIDVDNNENDYINASYIKNFKGEIKFIASQGPNKVMLDDFIRMLWEQKTNKLVMLTSVIEMGKLKCEQYWPDKGTTRFGKIRVKLISEERFAEYSMRKLELSKKDEPNHTVTQFHFEAWPDQNVPSSPWGLVDFYQLVSSSQSDKPIVVHCSAGVGRTGTFIGLFNLIEQARETGKVDFYKTLSELRQDRMWMIQTANQYEFLHKAVLVATVCSGTFMEMNDVSPRIYQLNQKNNSGKTKLEEEFETISKICTYLNDQMQPVSDEETDGVVYENTKNTSKNRFNDIIPKDICRPVLTCEPLASGDYINAVIFESFKHKDEHILTQLPLEATLVDFWRLVTEFNVSLIVAFETHLAATDKTIAEYLPSNEEQVMMCPPFKIHSAYMKQTDEWEERKLTITMKSTNHKVVHLKSKITDLNSKPFLSFIRQSRSYELLSEKILYVCRNGAMYSGLASVLTNLLDRLDNYLSCSVPLVVGTVKCIRPQAVPTLDQYNTVYDILNRYTETSCVYGNVDVNLLKKMDKK